MAAEHPMHTEAVTCDLILWIWTVVSLEPLGRISPSGHRRTQSMLTGSTDAMIYGQPQSGDCNTRQFCNSHTNLSLLGTDVKRQKNPVRHQNTCVPLLKTWLLSPYRSSGLHCFALYVCQAQGHKTLSQSSFTSLNMRRGGHSCSI